jgi:hypothetical protein
VHRNLSYRSLTMLATAAFAVPGIAQGQAPPAPHVVVNGVGYAQFVYQLKDTANHLNQFNLTRAYINVIGNFDGGIGTRITADVYASGSSLAYRLKYAFATYTPTGSALTFKLGLMQTPYVDYEEALWDYRMQGPIALDRNGYLTSSDLGVGADGKWNKDQVNMQVAFVNGEGYGNAATPGDQRKDLEARASVRVMNTNDMSRVGGLRITGYAGYGKPTGGGTRQRFTGQVSYRSNTLTLAGEYTIAKDSVVGAAKRDGQIISAFGVVRVPNSKVGVIARMDYVKPDKNAPSATLGFTNTRFIAGVSYQLSPNVRLLADIDNLSYKNGSPTPAAEAVRSQGLFQMQFTF